MRLKAILATTLFALTGLSFGQRLLTTDGATLKELNPATAASTTVATLTGGIGTVGALAYDPVSDTLFAASTSNDSLWRVNYVTGVCTLIGPFNRTPIDPVMHGLEYDTSTGKLYGLDFRDKGLVEIDKNTGQATLVGLTPFTSFGSLAYDEDNDVMYGGDNGTDSVYVINRLTGAGTIIGSGLGVNAGTGWAWSSATGVVTIENNGNDSLYRVNTTTGLATLIGLTGTTNALSLAFVPSLGSVTGVTIVEGFGFSGDLTSLSQSDDNRYCFFNDDLTLNCILDLKGTSPTDSPTVMQFTMEYQVTRPGLSYNVALKNFVSGNYVNFGGGVASTSDSQFDAFVTNDRADYVGPNKSLGARLTFAPINDEDPSQDGWLHCLDLARWTIQ